MLLNIYIDGLSDILNNSAIGGSIGGIRVNHMLYADDLCSISYNNQFGFKPHIPLIFVFMLLQNLLSISKVDPLLFT